MCGRVVYVWDAKTGRLIAKYDDGALDDPKRRHVLEKKRYNVPPASHLPFIVGRNGATRVEVARWGFPIPKRPNGVFNTRIETAAESPMWKGLLGKSHALLAARGFYEWRHDGREEPYFLHRSDGEPMLLAALVGVRRVEGNARLCASIVTCGPNPLVAALHDRMPVIVEEADAEGWLHPEADNWLDLARPAADGTLAMHEVSPDVNSTKNDRPDLAEPVAEQQRL